VAVLLPKRSELPWYWRPGFVVAHSALVIAIATLFGLAGYSARARDATIGYGHASPPPLIAWLIYAGFFAWGIAVGLLAAPWVWRRCWETWHLRREHERRYGGLSWRSMAAGFTREYWRSASRAYGGTVQDYVVPILMFGGAPLSALAIEYTLTGATGAGFMTAFFGVLVGGVDIPLLRLWRQLEE